jgi:hypothetical protein
VRSCSRSIERQATPACKTKLERCIPSRQGEAGHAPTDSHHAGAETDGAYLYEFINNGFHHGYHRFTNSLRRVSGERSACVPLYVAAACDAAPRKQQSKLLSPSAAIEQLGFAL